MMRRAIATAMPEARSGRSGLLGTMLGTSSRGMNVRFGRRRRPSLGALLLRGLGFAVASGIAAIMMLSPRTRHRALGAAKDTYGKMNEKLGHLRPRHRVDPAQARETDERPANGLGLAPDYGTSTEL